MSLREVDEFMGEDRPADPLIEKAVVDPLKHDLIPEAPDFTDSIMSRLGYRRQPPRQVRRVRVHRWLGRAALTCIAAMTVAVSLKIHEQMPSARVPEATTLPRAIEENLQERGRQFINLIDGVKRLTPPPSPVPAAESPIDDPDLDSNETEPGIDDSFTAPVRWV